MNIVPPSAADDADPAPVEDLGPITDPGVTDAAVRVYLFLRHLGVDPDSCHPSHAAIAAAIGKSPRSLSRLLAELEEKGWITRIPRYSARRGRLADGFAVYDRPTKDPRS